MGNIHVKKGMKKLWSCTKIHIKLAYKINSKNIKISWCLNDILNGSDILNDGIHIYLMQKSTTVWHMLSKNSVKSCNLKV